MISKPAPPSVALSALIDAAVAAFNALPPEERKKVLDAQAESYARRCVTAGHPASKPNWIDRGAWIAGQLLSRFPPHEDLAPERADPEDPRQSLDLPHLLFMTLELRDRKLDSETKVCRWLGWLQAGLVGCRRATLEEMKELNLASGGIAQRKSTADFQTRCQEWLDVVTQDDPTDLDERIARFVEEALELAQSFGMTQQQADQLSAYVFARPAGQPAQEFGGAYTTLAVLAEHTGHLLQRCGEQELARVWDPEVIEKIRGKRSRRHGRGPLPGTTEASLIAEL